ncbi:ribosomal protein L5 domain-containing protein [Thamnocephalis sphaerospora]|uniref:Ribosomal protein L5 domain-containing protein n=1 Tax=Thamnocephalis sphaerospora TaxID=78915 RepID=A0A4P9XKE2_9FUNG|nr:ribosomal protein L5 domain-containing protein [Thamnocephalis sphaerospora]RKP06612.1 ribosomal protein L5 domain-containing protein [Thamnocephalis sphaerospora]|eukprot:RKP06222.1 ribosomal protein L5 domain-containing protein [Thamnocephalis sphaerospora]
MALSHLRAAARLSALLPRAAATRGVSTLADATTSSRLHEHYDTTLRSDLMVLTYRHGASTSAPDAAPEPESQPEPEPEPAPLKRNAAYTVGEQPKHRGVRPKRPARRPLTYGRQPELERVIVHCMAKESVHNRFTLLSTFTAMRCITGVQPEVVMSHSNAAPWSLREGMPVGCTVELRGEKMYSFVETLTEIVMPRIKEWRALSGGSGDGQGNIAFGMPAHVMGLFPEIEEVYDRLPRLSGFDINFITTAQTNWEARLLLSGLGIPFQPRRSQIRAMLGENVKKPAPSQQQQQQ